MKPKNGSSTAVKVIFACFVLIFVGVCMFFLSYTNDYYHADESSEALISSSVENITVEKCDGFTIFKPEVQTSQVGFIFYPGGKVENTAYSALMIKLAERGITCFLLDVTLNLAIIDTEAADGICEKYPEIEKWYIGGHSLGGTVASLFIADNADKFDGLVLCAAYPSNDLSENEFPVLSVYGSNDGVMNMQSYSDSKAYMPADFTEYVIDGGCHAYFGNYGAQKGDGEPTITADEQQNIAANVITEWIKAK